VPTLNNIGVLYSREGQHQKALVAFERANKNSKFAKTPRYNLAKLYLTFGLANEALPLFRSLLQEAPKDVGLLNAVGSAYFLKGHYRDAVLHFQQIPNHLWPSSEIGPNFALSLHRLGKSS